MQVIVVGAGIGGLSLALSLHQAGITVRVYEAVRDLAPLGVGIDLRNPPPYASSPRWGWQKNCSVSAMPRSAYSYFNKHGQLVWSEPRGRAAGYNWAQYSIHRGHLQSLLLRAASERIGAANIRTGLRLTSFEQRDRKVIASFTDGTSLVATDEADILVGADGMHSKVRQQFYPNEGAPRFAQQLLWRAAVDAEPFLDGHTMIIAGHFHQRVIAYPMDQIQARYAADQLDLPIGCFRDAPHREDWNRQISGTLLGSVRTVALSVA